MQLRWASVAAIALTVAGICAAQNKPHDDAAYHFAVSQDMAQLWGLHADERNIFLNSFGDCIYEGFECYDTEYRWPALYKRVGPGWIEGKAPQAGRFYPGVVVYDGPGAEHYEMELNGEPLGSFAADADNNRQRLFFATEPIELNAGDTITLRSPGDAGTHIVEDLALLPERPEALSPPQEIRHFDVGWDWSAGCMRATWITTWPVACALQVGDQEIVEDAPLQNHRIYLRDLDAGAPYTCSIAATTREGTEIHSESVEFVAAPTPDPDGTVARQRIDLAVLKEGREGPLGLPLTAGIPFPEGALGSSDHLRLLCGNQELPLQARTLIRWPDNSVKVALIDCMMPEVADAQFGALQLEYGHEVTRMAPSDQQVRVTETDDTIALQAPTVRLEFKPGQSGLFTRAWYDPQGNFTADTQLTRDEAPPKIEVVGDFGESYDTLGPVEKVQVEEAGPLRAVVRLDGHHTGPQGHYMIYNIWVTAYAGVPWVKVAYRWINDSKLMEFTWFRGIRLELPLSLTDASYTMGTDGTPASGSLAAGARLEQLYDDSYTLHTPDGDTPGERAPGWVAAADARRSVGAFCKDFWQLYPKAVEARDRSLIVDLCPQFADDHYNNCSELDLYKLYYYLQDGRYKVRQGVSKMHEMQLTFGGPSDNIASLASKEPLLLAAQPEWYAESTVFGAFAPAGAIPQYDRLCEDAYDIYIADRSLGYEYGMLNFGDKWGERLVNWHNSEYDHQHVAAQMFVRSDEPKWFRLMEAIARHAIDVDLCHCHGAADFVGGQWCHSIGHTGGYFAQPYQDKYGYADAWMDPSHAWAQGTCEYYALTGDPIAVEAARMTADHWGGVFLNDYDFTNCRVPGWHLLLTLATYRATGDPYYLNAAHLVVDRVLERRTPGETWERQLAGGLHCRCWPRCHGACGFLVGILSDGLVQYHDVTDDEGVEDALFDTAQWVIENLWISEDGLFRSTSCPRTEVQTGLTSDLAALLLFAIENGNNDVQHTELLRLGLAREFEDLYRVSLLGATPPAMLFLYRQAP